MVSKLEEDEDPVLTFATLGEEDVVTAHKSGLVRVWRAGGGGVPEVVRTFRSIHTGPIAVCYLHLLESGGKLLATGGTDGSIKVLFCSCSF